MDQFETSAYAERMPLASRASTDARADFIAKTYFHLAGAVGVFAGLIAIFLNTPPIFNAIISLLTIPYGALILIGGFILVSYLAQQWAQNATSPAVQYLGLGLYVVAEAVIFTPLIYVADRMGNNVIETSAVVTLVMFAAMSVIVFVNRRDFSFLRPMLCMASFGAFLLVICAMLFNFTLGPIFAVAMITLACGYILYDTSNVVHHYRIGQHVAAALALFASVALLFWYVIRLVMSLQSRD